MLKVFVLSVVLVLAVGAPFVRAEYLPSPEDRAAVIRSLDDPRNIKAIETGFGIEYGKTHEPGELAAMVVTSDGFVWRLEEWSRNEDSSLQMSFWNFWEDQAVAGALTFRGNVVISKQPTRILKPQNQEAIEKSEKVWRLLRRLGQPL